MTEFVDVEVTPPKHCLCKGTIDYTGAMSDFTRREESVPSEITSKSPRSRKSHFSCNSWLVLHVVMCGQIKLGIRICKPLIKLSRFKNIECVVATVANLADPKGVFSMI